MKRTQIYLDEDILHFLRVESKIRHKRMSSIIRDILKKEISKEKIAVSVIDEVAGAGIWSDRKFDVEKYIRNLRKTRKSKW